MVSEILSQIPIYIGHAFFSINVFPIILLFSIGIQKRKHFAWRIVLGFLISVCCSAPFSHGLFTYIMQFTLFSAVILHTKFPGKRLCIALHVPMQYSISAIVYIWFCFDQFMEYRFMHRHILCVQCALHFCCTGLSEENYLKMDIMMWIFVSLWCRFSLLSCSLWGLVLQQIPCLMQK